jgi:hypothetical protein
MCFCSVTSPFTPLVPVLEKPGSATDLISFLKALPDCRMRRGIRFPQWWMLLVASLAIYRFAEG